MGDKTLLTDVFEQSNLTYAVKPQDFLDLVKLGVHGGEASNVKYEGLEEGAREQPTATPGRVDFGSTLERRDADDDAECSRLLPSVSPAPCPSTSGDESALSDDSDDLDALPARSHGRSDAKAFFLRMLRPCGADGGRRRGSEFRLLRAEKRSKKGKGATFTIDEAVDALGFGKFQVKLSLLTGLAWMADAMEMMILSILSPALRCDWWLDSWQQALITTVVFCGMMLSSTMWGNLSDRYGRKSELILCTSVTFYFGFLSSLAPSFYWLLVLRALVGFGIGGVPQSVTLYAEFLPSSHRAKCVVLIEAFWAIGTCFEVLLALFVMPTLGWRWLLAFSAMPLLVFTLCCMWLPESARFHVASGQPELALATLRRVAQENGRPMPAGKLVESNVQNLKRGRVVDLFVRELRWTTIPLWFIWFANAFSYYGIVLLTTELFQNGDQCHGGAANEAVSAASAGGEQTLAAGVRPSCYLECKHLSTSDYTDLLWTTLAEFPGLIITAVTIEWLGRKRTMAGEFLIFSLAVFLLFACLDRKVVTVFIFTARAFISGAFQAAYVYTPEVYPTTTRAIGLGSCSAFARLGAIITPFVAQVAVNTSVNIPIATYGSVCIVAAGVSLLLPIETKGREMKDTHE